MRNHFRLSVTHAHTSPARQRLDRNGYRVYVRAAYRRRTTVFWSKPPSPARLLCALVRRIIKFHDSQPLLNSLPKS